MPPNGHLHAPRGRRLLAAAMAVGLLLGSLAAWLWLWLTPPSVSMEDYVVVVAAAYAREHLPLNATDRLIAAGVGNPSVVVNSVATDYRRKHPERQQDIAYLEQLEEALRPQASAGTTTSVNGSTAGSGPNWTLWLLLLVIVTVCVVAALVLRSRLVFSPPGRRPTGREWQSLPPADEPALEKAELVGGMRAAEPEEREGPSRQSPIEILPPASLPSTRSLSTLTGQRRRLSLRPFVCSYHAGEEPFEDVHPIIHEDGGELIGAVGLTATARLGSVSPARYYAFSAWVHDYLSGEPMHASGLLSPWASGRKPTGLYDPALAQATLHRTEKGLAATMETANLIVTVEVTDLGYGIARDVPINSYFTILSVRFGVTIKGVVNL